MIQLFQRNNIKSFCISFAVISAMVVLQSSLAQAIYFDEGGKIAASLGLSSSVDLRSAVINITKWVLGLLGLVAVILMVVGGFMYMTSGGNEEKVKKAVSLIKAALVGLIIVMLSYALARFVFDTIKQQSGA